MSREPATTLKRSDVYPSAVVDGRVPRNGTSGRLHRGFQRLLVSNGEREESDLEQRLRSLPAVTRPNTVALISPKGGVGKTTSTFVVGNLLAGHLKLRVIAVDANPDFGRLGRLSSDARRSERSLADLLDDADGLKTAAELNPYVSRQATGLHILASSADPETTASLGPDSYGELVAFSRASTKSCCSTWAPALRVHWRISPSSEPTRPCSSRPPSGSPRQWSWTR